MDRLDRMRLLVRVIERRSFTAAAADLGLARSSATEAIKQLEVSLGVRLIERTTRTVLPTLDGEVYYRRCLSILSDVEDAEGAFRAAQPRGLLRINVPPPSSLRRSCCRGFRRSWNATRSSIFISVRGTGLSIW